MAPGDVLRLQRAVGNGAVARMLAGGGRGDTVRRAVTVGGERITHASRKVGDLWTRVVVPALEREGLKTYGVKSRLVAFIQAVDAQYASGDAFLQEFLPWLGKQTRAVKGGKEVPVLKKFEVLGMARPTWPDELRKLKGFQAGDNIRHVVRNATLKLALDVEAKRVQEDRKKQHFTALAAGLGIDVPDDASLDVVVPAIYRKIYLNPDNLFSGDGPTNQIIGFAADPVRRLGEAYLAAEEERVNLLEVYKRVMEAVYAAADKVQADGNYKQQILRDIDAVVQSAVLSLGTQEEPTAPAEVAGDVVSDIGLGFGFDLIDGRADEDVQGYAARQRRLLWSEGALQGFIRAQGNVPTTLEQILKVFVGLADVPG